MAFCTSDNIGDVKQRLQDCLRVLKLYEWAIDSYVLDFFVENHRDRISNSWWNVLAEMSPEDLALWLDNEIPWTNQVVPLELLCLRKTLSSLCLRRKPVESPMVIESFFGTGKRSVGREWNWKSFEQEFTANGLHHKSLHHVFRKHVKPKKQHEVTRMADVTKIMASRTNCSVVLDIGSGVGHLSRLLSVRHQFRVVCVDSQNDFVSSAQKFDSDLKKILASRGEAENIGDTPDHLTFRLTHDEVCAQDLYDKVCELSPACDRYGILGLHSCGDLGPTLIKLFANSSENAVFLQSVGCCYMKMEHMYPMSQFLASQEWFQLSYTARELSCHAIEMYRERLLEDKDKLKVHCYRSVLEYILIDKAPSLKHHGLKTVNKAHEKSFCDYSRVATSNLNLHWTDDEFENESVMCMLKEWWKVVIFYSFRLSFAPLIETVILLDRLIFLKEQGLKRVALLPIFDPVKSPRNHVLLSFK